MNALAITVFFSVILALLAVAGFIWDHAARKDDGYDRESLRPLDEDGPGRPAP